VGEILDALFSLQFKPFFRASDESRGMHSGKEHPMPRIGNASEVSIRFLGTAFLA
jgi:hypothetical protein